MTESIRELMKRRDFLIGGVALSVLTLSGVAISLPKIPEVKLAYERAGKLYIRFDDVSSFQIGDFLDVNRYKQHNFTYYDELDYIEMIDRDRNLIAMKIKRRIK